MRKKKHFFYLIIFLELQRGKTHLFWEKKNLFCKNSALIRKAKKTLFFNNYLKTIFFNPVKVFFENMYFWRIILFENVFEKTFWQHFGKALLKIILEKNFWKHFIKAFLKAHFFFWKIFGFLFFFFFFFSFKKNRFYFILKTDFCRKQI